jgi:hypothetical protein
MSTDGSASIVGNYSINENALGQVVHRVDSLVMALVAIYNQGTNNATWQ